MNECRSVAALLLLVSICNGTNYTVDGQQMRGPEGADEQIGIMASTRYARDATPRAPPTEFEVSEMMPPGGHDEAQLVRFRRQLTVPKDSPLNLQGPQQQPAGGANFFSTLSDNAKTLSSLSSLFSPQGQQGGQGQGQQAGQQSGGSNPFSALTSAFGGNGGGSTGGFSMESFMRQLAELNNMIRSTQERNARTLEATQRSAENVGQETMTAARSAQGGIQQALTEMGQGLSRIATNNPNLVPDITNLYRSVAARLSQATTSVAQTAQSQQAPTGGSGFPALPTAQL